MQYILALDQGTTSSSAVLVGSDGQVRASAQTPFRQIFPKPGWVEHDPQEIWSSQFGVAMEALAQGNATASSIAAIGITNQRETTIIWDRKTGEPIYNAIVWQDRRTSAFCDGLREQGLENLIRQKTGLVIDAYFAGSKIRWLLDNVPGARARAERGELAFGTVDSWLIWKLTEGARHVTDVTNASRTMLLDIQTQQWDEELLRIFEIPASLLPEVISSSEVCGGSAGVLQGVPIAGVAGDQHAALFGQICTTPGAVKCTYGTGSFMLMNTGETPVTSRSKLVTTIAWRIGGRTNYALEGSVFIAGAVVQWLRDELQMIRSSSEIEELAASVPDTAGVYFVPAFSGLGAPHWDQYARGALVGLTRGTNRGHIARAALEGIAFQVADIIKAMETDSGVSIPELRVDGGAVRNDLLMQLQADLLGTRVTRPANVESTVMGATYLAGLAVGYWPDQAAIAKQWAAEKTFVPGIHAEERGAALRALGAGGGSRAQLGSRLACSARKRCGASAAKRRGMSLWSAGGATGLGAAVEAASRGYRTLLLEAEDFAKGTSSRSTKLVHGGVRYLAQGDLKLVLEALGERGRMLKNAPHLVRKQAFIVPAYSWFDLPFYGAGLTAYDLLARGEGFGRSRVLSRRAVEEKIPTVKTAGLRGGILYYDGQFDDARFAVTLLGTLLDLGGVVLNYAPVTGFVQQNGSIVGVQVTDLETGDSFEVTGRSFINATGVFVDKLRQKDEPGTDSILAVSQGTHIVLPRAFLPGDAALMVPKTADGRVLFAIPWHEQVVIGTTDNAVPDSDTEPKALEQERDYLFEHVKKYLSVELTGQKVLSIWSGQRPLVKKAGAKSTAALSRDHTILISPSKLITITGGKWTTYRRMGEDVIDRAAEVAGLKSAPSRTADLRLHGWTDDLTGMSDWDRMYGSDLPKLQALGLTNRLHPDLPFCEAQVVWGAQQEMARTVEDVLARRLRALFLNARASMEAAPAVARILREQLNRSVKWESLQVTSFRTLAARYIW